MTSPSGFHIRTILNGQVSRKVVARMIWAAFPGPSENEVSERASLVLGLSDRHIRRLLRCEHDVNGAVVLTLIALIGMEAAFSIMGREAR